MEQEEKERNGFEDDKKRLRNIQELCEADKITERKKMCEILQKQLQDKQNENQRITEIERQDYIKMMNSLKQNPSNMCPHGKYYKCGECKMSYPRKYFTKVPLNSH